MKTMIKVCPKYGLNEVIDLSYKHGGLPNRILIRSVFRREYDTEWFYQVVMENSGNTTTMAESFISERAISRGKIYSKPVIIKRYEDGYRWAGNFKTDEAYSQAKLMANCDHIDSVKLCTALYPDGRVAPDMAGIWIKYINTISNDGSINNNNASDCIAEFKGKHTQ